MEKNMILSVSTSIFLVFCVFLGTVLANRCSNFQHSLFSLGPIFRLSIRSQSEHFLTRCPASHSVLTAWLACWLASLGLRYVRHVTLFTPSLEDSNGDGNPWSWLAVHTFPIHCPYIDFFSIHLEFILNADVQYAAWIVLRARFLKIGYPRIHEREVINDGSLPSISNPDPGYQVCPLY